MAFAESGDAALEKLQQKHFDVIVTDMRMPEMDGVELLEQVKKCHPDMIRFVLSGHSDREMIKRSVGTAHQFLSKPCNADYLKASIKKALLLRQRLASQQLRRMIGNIGSLPVLPALYQKLQTALKDPNCDIERVANIISQDVSMSGKILHLVSSAFFGIPRKVETVKQALSLLGLEIVQSLVLTTGLFDQFTQKELEAFPIEEIFHHSLRVGFVAGEVMKTFTGDRQLIADAFNGGMMHDVGKLVQIDLLPDQTREIWQAAKESGENLADTEYSNLGYSHAEVGGYLLGVWGFPDRVVSSVTFHHTPGSLSDAEPTAGTAVHVANALVHVADGKVSWKLKLDECYIDDLGLKEQLPQWLRRFGSDQ
jgi:HD-like signal output (HDOD) protein